MTKIVELIYTEFRAGKGTTEDPYRLVAQLLTKDGRLIAEYDAHTGAHAAYLNLIDTKD